MAEHYGTVIIPARVKKPRDKSKVETGVQIAERQILAALRDQRFFSVVELNAARVPLLAKLNARAFQKLEGSRDSWYESVEKPRLLPLPSQPFDLAVWSQAKVNIDYHVVVEKHFYSVHYSLVNQTVDARMDGAMTPWDWPGIVALKRAPIENENEGKILTLFGHLFMTGPERRFAPTTAR